MQPMNAGARTSATDMPLPCRCEIRPHLAYKGQVVRYCYLVFLR